jgi:adenosylhomocysteine nucleosidase
LTIFPDHKKGSYKKGVDPFVKANKTLVKLALEAGKANNIPCYVGTVVTGNSFINEPLLKKETIKYFEGLCDEMEGASVGKFCSDRGVPFVVIRCISDKPEKKENLMYNKHYKDAAKRCAIIVESFCGALAKEKNKDVIEKLKEDMSKIHIRKPKTLEM